MHPLHNFPDRPIKSNKQVREQDKRINIGDKIPPHLKFLPKIEIVAHSDQVVKLCCRWIVSDWRVIADEAGALP